MSPGRGVSKVQVCSRQQQVYSRVFAAWMRGFTIEVPKELGDASRRFRVKGLASLSQAVTCNQGGGGLISHWWAAACA